MAKRKFISLSVKFSIIISVMLVIFIMLTNYLSIKALTQTLEENLNNVGKTLTENVALSVKSALIAHDYSFVNQVLKQTITENEDILDGLILNKDYKVIESYFSTGSVPPEKIIEARIKFLKNKENEKVIVKEFIDNFRNIKTLDFAKNLIVRGERQYTILFGFSLKALKLKKDEAFRRTIAIGIISVLLGLLISMTISRMVVKPIKQLVEDAATIASGNLEKEIEIRTSDEVGLLGHAFERMRISLRQHIKEIAKKALSLEGGLDVFNLPDLLQLICTGLRTGKLILESDEGKGVIYFEVGDITNSEITINDQKFEGKLALFKFFNWVRGSFKFDPGKFEVERIINMPWQHLMLEGARQTDELSRIKQLIPSEDTMIKVVENPPSTTEEVKLTMEELQISILVQGEKPVSAILEESTFDELETYQIIYRLITAGLLEVKDN